MDSIEAQRVKTVPGNLLMMRRAEEETANQCSNTKESTGAPVSASEQDSLTGAQALCTEPPLPLVPGGEPLMTDRQIAVQAEIR